MRPGLTTLQTKASFPMRLKSSFFVHFLRAAQFVRRLINSLCFPSGILMVRLVESISIPKYVINVAVPTFFSMASGIPRSLNAS